MISAFDDLHQILSYMATALTIGLALLIGRGPERACGLIVAAETFVDIVVMSQFDPSMRWWAVQIKAGLVLSAYAAAVWRWPDRWLIVMTALQGCALLLHLSTWLDSTILMRSNGLLLNSIGWLMMILLVSATIGKAIQRHDARRRLIRRQTY
ncbi:hypothetical protein MU852_10875 [Brevundimonas albigilva]|uniref:hypothetical protein n=1 Tax=Brevundimonas albigilva TaxID=1312364 RepID=UPI00201B91FE|nr:hypothetical protein [Brevundimonas albigilva]UQV17410.1 hypothetical protein MU852_10875 [Brevundimonas albigilva]